MADIDFLSLDDVLLAHLDQIRRYGGDPDFPAVTVVVKYADEFRR